MQFTDPTKIDYVDPKNIVPVAITSKGSCEKIVITTADGRVFSLGKPTSVFFKLRVALYKWRRRQEFSHG